MDWREASRVACIKEYLQGPIKVVGEDSDDSDDDESLMKEIRHFHVSHREALVLFDKIMCTTGIDAEDRESLSKLNKK